MPCPGGLCGRPVAGVPRAFLCCVCGRRPVPTTGPRVGPAAHPASASRTRAGSRSAPSLRQVQLVMSILFPVVGGSKKMALSSVSPFTSQPRSSLSDRSPGPWCRTDLEAWSVRRCRLGAELGGPVWASWFSCHRDLPLLRGWEGVGVGTCVPLTKSVSCSANGSWRGQVHRPVVRAQHGRPGSQVRATLRPPAPSLWGARWGGRAQT